MPVSRGGDVMLALQAPLGPQSPALGRWLGRLLFVLLVTLVCVGPMTPPALAESPNPEAAHSEADIEARIEALLAEMTLAEKVGQMNLRGFGSSSQRDPAILEEAIRQGEVGALLNIMDVDAVDRLQRIAVEESRLGIPILFGRDVIHGFRTVFPIPLGQAATWNPELVERAARVSAEESSTYGIRWTFAPMADITRDPRWGRIAESPGEDPFLAEQLTVAMVRGFQGDDLTRRDALAACAKHFAAYGAAEGGRDYNTVDLSGASLHNVYLRPFRAAVDAGAQTFMTAFNELNGVPATAHPYLLRTLLRDTWGFDGFVVSDWESVTEMIAHGFCGDAACAAERSANAGLDLEMTSRAFEEHLAEQVTSGAVDVATVDAAVRNLLRVKLRLGLFEDSSRNPAGEAAIRTPEALEMARETARQSLVLLRNASVGDRPALPLTNDLPRLAVIGPLADAPHEQLGTWTYDGQSEETVTVVDALRQRFGGDRVRFAPALSHSRSTDTDDFERALAAARAADATVVVAGEEAILSGEAHSRADLRLPGAQEDLIHALADTLEGTGKPLILVVLSGRPNTFANVLERVDALLIGWHPGSEGGPAIADVLFGDASPSGRLPVTWPKSAGQIPIHYNHKNTGRPAPDELIAFEDIPVGAWQSSLSNTSHYLDLGKEPQFPFGFGLGYSTFAYSDLVVGTEAIDFEGGVGFEDSVEITATVTNTGDRRASEVAQLYSRDPVASLTRPVRELRGFERITLEPGEATTVRFTLRATDLAFFDNQGQQVLEPGTIQVWVGPHAREGLEGQFEIVR